MKNYPALDFAAFRSRRKLAVPPAPFWTVVKRLSVFIVVLLWVLAPLGMLLGIARMFCGNYAAGWHPAFCCTAICRSLRSACSSG